MPLTIIGGHERWVFPIKFYIRVAYKGGIGFLPEGVGTPLKTVDQMISNYGYFLTTQISLKGYHSKLDSSQADTTVMWQ